MIDLVEVEASLGGFFGLENRRETAKMRIYEILFKILTHHESFLLSFLSLVTTAVWMSEAQS